MTVAEPPTVKFVETTKTTNSSILQIGYAPSPTSPSLQALARQVRRDATATAANELQMTHKRTAPMDSQRFLEYLYRTGKILNMPAPRKLTPKELQDRERRAELFGKGKPASEIISEDRGLW